MTPAAPATPIARGLAPLSVRWLALVCLLAFGCESIMATDDPTVHSGVTSAVACVDCHQHDYERAKSPDHAASKLPTNCDTCHDKSNWSPATWGHQTWPLTGEHVTTPCAGCHGKVPNKLAKPPRDCAGCHLPAYQNAEKPDHVSGGYPTTCQTCHTAAGWAPAEMENHTFPITSGTHKGVPCASCHVNPKFKVFTCMTSGCHPKGETDKDHSGEVSSYVYEAASCYACHPKGKD